MKRTDLYQLLLETDGPGCVWPECGETRWVEMAHLRGIGMGGRKSADVLSNVARLCRRCHDLLDGRSHAGLRRAMGVLLAAYVAQCRDPAPK